MSNLITKTDMYLFTKVVLKLVMRIWILLIRIKYTTEISRGQIELDPRTFGGGKYLYINRLLCTKTTKK